MRTSRTSQQAMFLENLWRSIEKLSASNNNILSKTASKYFSEGYDQTEIVELLVSDGFDPQMSQSCVAQILCGKELSDIDESEGTEWGFEAEHQENGDIFSNFDLGYDNVKALNEEQAMEHAQLILDELGMDLYFITKVYTL